MTSTTSSHAPTQSDAAQGLGQLDEIGDAMAVRRQICLAVALVVEQRLPLSHHAQVSVVDQGDLIGTPSTAQVANSWLVIWKQPSPSIAHFRLRAGHLRAHGGRNREAHGAQPPS